ncbi:MAG: phage holin family protein [Myxococcota bacterium]|nr:phage holin family protein [Myxococcota bacterium]
MVDLIIKWGVLSSVLMAAAAGLPTVKVRNWGAAFGGAAVFGIANLLLGSALGFIAKIITFPAAILSFGLVWLVIPIVVNMAMLKIADHATGDDLMISGLPALVGLSTAMTVTSAVLNWLFV